MTVPTCSPASLEVIATVSPFTTLPFASFTVAVAVEVDVPFATIDAGFSATVTLVAGPVVWVSVAVPLTFGEADVSVAVIVACPALVELVTVAE